MATHQDDEGVPLCQSCYDQIVSESPPEVAEERAIARVCSHGNSQIDGLGLCVECVSGMFSGMNAELAQLRAENAELKRKNGLLARGIRGWRAWYKCEPHHPTKQDQTAVERNAADFAIDAGGALGEVGG